MNKVLSTLTSYLFTGILLIQFISCKKENEIIKKYYHSGKIKEIHFLSEGSKDSSIYYSETEQFKKHKYLPNGRVFEKNFNEGFIISEGKLLNNKERIDIWKFYNNGLIKEKKEFLSINGEIILNQKWSYDNHGKIIKNKSDFYEMAINKDTIFIGEPIKASIDLKSTIFKTKAQNKSSIYIVIPHVPKGSSVNFNSDFSNELKIKKDTFYDLNLEKEFRKAIGLRTDFRKSAIFGRYYYSTGVQFLRGYIVEQIGHSEIDSLGNNHYHRKIYFEKKIYVKDTASPAVP